MLTPVSVRRKVRIAVRLSPVVALTEDRIAVKPSPVTFLARLAFGSCSFDSSFAVDFKPASCGRDSMRFRNKGDEDPRQALDFASRMFKKGEAR